MRETLKTVGAVLLVFIAGGLVGGALEQRLAPKPVPPAQVYVPVPERSPTTRSPHKAKPHHVPHRSASDDSADQLNRGQL